MIPSAFPRRPVLGVTALVLALVPSARLAAGGEATFVSPSESRLRSDVSYLADDRREGRGAGTLGLEQAAEYIADAFRAAGLQPAPGADGYFQRFEIAGPARVRDDTMLVLTAPGGARIEPKLKQGFTPLAIGGAGTLKDLPIVFAGYGITAHDRALKLDYDDYQGLDVRGKAVLILRREPQQDDQASPFAGADTTSYATFRHKARNAADHGAAAVLLVNDAAGLRGGKDQLLDFSATEGNAIGIPFLMITRALADRVLSAAGAPPLAELERAIDTDLEPVGRPLEGWTLAATVAVDRNPIVVRNVIGVLEGAGPLAPETIVVGAHYDHLGRGGPGSLAFGSGDIHNGADDNASGTAMVLELARRLAARADPLPRRVVFMAFAGEERGLLGSRHYVEHPLFPLRDTVTMVNFDMVGRLNADDALNIYGGNSSPSFAELVTALADTQGLRPKVVTQGADMRFFGASDHASFYRKDIPILFAFTGVHPDYHKPSDDVERINFDGMRRIANFGELLLLDLALRPDRPAFVKVPPTSSPGSLALRAGPEGAMPYMGTRPAYYGEEGIQGVKLDGVSEGSPAEKAGLKGGDIIVKFDGKTVVDIKDYMEGLTRHQPGDTVEVVVKQGGEEKALQVTLGTRSGAR